MCADVVAVVSGASRRLEEVVAEITAAYARAGSFQATVVGSSDEATAVARAAAGSATVVVAVGGDGTVSDVATGIFGTGAALGIVPAGSTNIVARSLGIPRDPRQALLVLAGPHGTKQIDVGHLGDRCFLHMAGAGFDAALFQATNRSLKRAFGWLAYLPAAAASLRIPPSAVRVTIDGDFIERASPLVLVANGSSIIAPTLELFPGIAMDDGWLDVLIVSAVTPAQIAATAGLAGLRRLAGSPHVTHRRGRSIRIDADPPLPVQLDGDVRGVTPAQLTVTQRGLRVVVPAR